MLEDTPKGEGHEIIQTVLSEMELTGNLSQSLQTAGVFPDYMCSMVEIGEMSGKTGRRHGFTGRALPARGIIISYDSKCGGIPAHHDWNDGYCYDGTDCESHACIPTGV